MFTLFKPSDTQVADFLAEQKDLPFSYPEIGASKDELPAGYPINHRRELLGSGAQTYARARKAIENWTMYDLTWTQLSPPKIPIASGESVCVVVNHGFCWSLNPCRIVYVLSEINHEVERYGFAFGTLPGHSETGEERFTVEWNQINDSVYYELLSFARPHHILAKLGFPFVKIFQRKFANDSASAMLSFIGNK